MYLHLGATVDIAVSDIIAIINYESIKLSQSNAEFLNYAKKSGNVHKLSEEDIKSIIIVNVNKKQEVYLSPISTTTLLKRANYIDTINKL